MSDGARNGPMVYDPGYDSYVRSYQISWAAASHRPKPPNLSPTFCFVDKVINNTNPVQEGGFTFLVCNRGGYWVDDWSSNGNGTTNSALSGLSGSSINAAVSLLELPETLDMLGNAMKNAADAVKRFRKGDLIGGITALAQDRKLSRRNKGKIKANKSKSPESLYLEMTFGWQPFFQDVKGAAEAINRKMEKGKKVKSTRSDIRETQEERKQALGFDSYQNASSTNKAQANVTVTARGTVESSQTVLLNGMGFINPLSALWEKIPYSFVVDYFIDIGGFLEALTATAGFTDVNYCKVVRHVARKINHHGEAASIVNVARIPYDNVLAYFPGLAVSGASGKQYANMTALLAQRLRV